MLARFHTDTAHMDGQSGSERALVTMHKRLLKIGCHLIRVSTMAR